MTKITETKPVDDHHQVVLVEGMGSHRREPCGGCPWRIDQTGAFPAGAFRISADTCFDGALKLFACHESGLRRPATCAGFLIVNSAHNVIARMRGISGGRGCSSPVPLHPSYKAMAIANGVAPDDPAIALCRADNERAVVVRGPRA